MESPFFPFLPLKKVQLFIYSAILLNFERKFSYAYQ